MLVVAKQTTYLETPAMLYTKQKLRRIQHKRIGHQAQTVDSYSFFNLLTSEQLLSVVEDQLPDHRERLYPPTATLSVKLRRKLNYCLQLILTRLSLVIVLKA